MYEWHNKKYYGAAHGIIGILFVLLQAGEKYITEDIMKNYIKASIDYLKSKMYPSGMAIRVVEFSCGGTKLERFLPKNQHTQGKLLNFQNWVNGEVSKFDFQSQFSISKIIRIFLNFFSLKNIYSGAHFLITSIFKSLYFLR